MYIFCVVRNYFTLFRMCSHRDRLPIFLIATDRLAAVNAEILNPSDITHDVVIGEMIYLKMKK